MNSESGAILLVVRDQRRLERYQALLAACGAACGVANSLQEAVARASEEPHAGVLLDMPLMIRVPDSLKIGVQDLLGGLPSATLNIHAVGGVRILPRGALASACSSLEQFISTCAGFRPRIISTRNRKAIHFNVLFDTAAGFVAPERSVCIDISVGGCFLFCVRDDISVDSAVWVKLPDLLGDSPLKGVVCWVRRWGSSRKIPGIGVRFEDIPDEMAKAIAGS